MKPASIRFWYGIAAAVIAAAIADPMIESASNAGWFGPGILTDHSNLDVLPALICGAIFVACFLTLRVRRDALARLACLSARTTVRILRRFRALATRALHAPTPISFA